MVAHNCPFDAPRFWLAVQQLSMQSEFKTCIQGFLDTLLYFQRKFPKRENGHKLTTLASDLLSISCENAHDAKFDVSLLEQLTVQFVDISYLIEKKKLIKDVENTLENYFKTKQNLPAYTPMKSILKLEMLKRLCRHVTYEDLVKTYKTEELRGEVGGKPQVIKTARIMTDIINYLESLQ